MDKEEAQYLLLLWLLFKEEIITRFIISTALYTIIIIVGWPPRCLHYHNFYSLTAKEIGQTLSHQLALARSVPMAKTHNVAVVETASGIVVCQLDKPFTVVISLIANKLTRYINFLFYSF